MFEECFLTTAFKKEKVRDDNFDVAQTRNCAVCGSDEELSWLELNPFITRIIKQPLISEVY